jgi:hypothetical protein
MALTEEQKQSRAEARRLTAALKEEAQAHRREAKQREWHEKDMYLTCDQAAAGEACRGCGLPVIDNLGSWPPLMHLTEDQRLDHDAAEARFRELHPCCHAHRWSMEGSRAMHCGLCCPPLPLSPSQIEHISRISKSVTRSEEELDVWAITLTCGHRVEHEVHYTNRQWSGLTSHCTECGVTRGVVMSERIIEAADRQAEAKRKRYSEVRRAEHDVVKAEAAAAEARRRLAALQRGAGDK